MKVFLSVMGCALTLSALVGYLFWGMALPWMIDFVGAGPAYVKVGLIYIVVFAGGVGIPFMILLVGFLIAINVIDEF